MVAKTIITLKIHAQKKYQNLYCLFQSVVSFAYCLTIGHESLKMLSDNLHVVGASLNEIFFSLKLYYFYLFNKLLRHYCNFRFSICLAFCLIKSICIQDPSTAVLKTLKKHWNLVVLALCCVCTISRFHVIKLKVLPKTLPYEEWESRLSFVGS